MQSGRMISKLSSQWPFRLGVPQSTNICPDWVGGTFLVSRFSFLVVLLRLTIPINSKHKTRNEKRETRNDPYWGCRSITVISGLAQNLTRGAEPPSIPIPRFTYIQVFLTRYRPDSYCFPNLEYVIRAP